jgi:putative amide transporter protein
VLGLKREEFTRYTGWVTVVEAWVTAAIPAFLLLTDLWRNPALIAIALAAIAVVGFGALYAYMQPRAPRAPTPTAPTPTAHPAAG